MNTCYQCFEPTTNPKFCSRSCSAKYTNTKKPPRSPQSREKTSKAMTGKKQHKITNAGILTKNIAGEFTRVLKKPCSCCNKEFYYDSRKSYKRTCSPECARKNSTYRKIVHEYPHNNEILLLESSWEVEIATWLDSNNIEWIRPPHIKWTDSSEKVRKYFPDFYLPKYNLYLDPKNKYQIKIGEEKLSAISTKIDLVYGTVDYIKTIVWHRLSDSN